MVDGDGKMKKPQKTEAALHVDIDDCIDDGLLIDTCVRCVYGH